MRILKRDGQSVEFDQSKIYSAIFKAAEASKENLEPMDIDYVVHKVVNQLQNPCTVEQVQDMVEQTLIKYDFEKTAKAYILYRAQRTKIREADSELMEIFNELTNTDAKDSDIKRENANVDGNTAMGTMLKYGSESAKYYVDKYILPEKIAKAHKDGDIHIHDKDFYLITQTCCQIDPLKLFKNGFSTGHGFLREPQSIGSYASLACIAIQANQNEMHGGQSIPNFDYAMAPGVIKTFKKEFKTALSYGIEDLYGISPTEAKEYANTFIEKIDGISFDPVEVGFPEELAVKLGKDHSVSLEFVRDMFARSYERAFKKTDKATYQAMEAVIHNLNTMHCLPGSERIWIKEGDTVKLISMKELSDNFKLNKYKALSLNPKTGRAAWKNITASKKMDNHRDLVTIKTNLGQKVTVTTNHKISTMIGADIQFDYPENCNNILTLKSCDERMGKRKVDISKYGEPRVDTPINAENVTISDAMAELLGIYAGDGSVVSGSQMELAVGNKIQEDYLSEIVNKAFEKPITYKTLNRGHNNDVSIYRFNLGTRACRFLKDYVGRNAKTKCVPNEILTGPNSVKQAFLKGYFNTDGRQTVKYQHASSISKDLIKGINYIIHSLGELAYLPEMKINKYNNLTYELSFGNAVANRLCVDTVGNARCEMLKYNTSMLWLHLKDKCEFFSGRKNKSVSITELEKYLSAHPEDKDICEKFLNVFCVDIKEQILSNSNEEYVYDISVEDFENFMTEDCLFVHNSRAGAQTPFSSINYGTDTSPEGRMVVKNLLLATEAGLGNGETPIFPVQIYKVKEGINYNEGEPNHDLFKLAIKVSAKRLFPNFSFIDAPFNLSYYKEGDYNTEVAYMGCRTRVMANHHDPSKAVVCGRGNLSFTSINLPRLGIESKGDWNLFYEKLDNILELCSEQLLHRLKIQSAKKVKNYPFLMGQGVWIDSDKLGPEDTVGEVLKEGTLSIGFIGLAETMVAMIGKHHGEDVGAREKAFEIVKHIREFCDDKSNETGLNFTCLATPEHMRVA